MRTLLTAALLAGLLSSCFMTRERVNEPLEKAKIDALVIGTATATEVAQELGAPSEVVQLGKRSAWRYDFTTTKTAQVWLGIVNFGNIDRRSDRCWLFFDETSVLRHVGTTIEADDTQYAMPWEDVD